MSTALYRRYRPENFAEMIGQSQVTDPLMTALRSDRIGHAYLFSGPRGCGKTTSARILARCLNCAEGPTDTPCGVCPSCVELSRGGGGSLDVIEMDAASNGGVEDARDLRERAIFAPSRDRYKIFIIDEAHMVTMQGFNALLKLVEEPPPHVKFIFATTEPEKVIGTIRSRTHHYPFRLVPPAMMIEYVEKLCGEEGITPDPGVLPLLVRAGGGSPRDTLSILDQLIAGSEGATVSYERAVALLGYTHGELLDEVIDAFAAALPAAAFAAVDRVVQTGQDPRRFVEDLLERLRDLIVIAATGDQAASVLRGLPADELERMSAQAAAYGVARLSKAADIVSVALDGMAGATSPRLQLELMIARVLTADGAVPAAAAPVAATAPAQATPGVAPTAAHGAAPGASSGDAPVTSPGATPVASPGVVPAASPVAAPAASPVASPAATPVASPAAPSARGPEPPHVASPKPSHTSDAPRPEPVDAPVAGQAAPAAEPATTEPTVSEPASAENTGRTTEATVGTVETDEVPGAAWATAAPGQESAAAAPATSPVSVEPSAPAEGTPAEATPATSAAPVSAEPTPAAAAPLTSESLRAAWPRIIAEVERESRATWLVLQAASPAGVKDDIVRLAFTNAGDLAHFKTRAPDGSGPSADLRNAIEKICGVHVRYVAKHIPGEGGGSASAPQGPPAGGAPAARPESATRPAPQPSPAAAPQAAAPATGWAVAAIPGASTEAPTAKDSAPAPSAPVGGLAPAPTTSTPAPAAPVVPAAPADRGTTAPGSAPAALATAPAAPHGAPAVAPPPFSGGHDPIPDDEVPPDPYDEYPPEEPSYSAPTVHSRQIQLDEGVQRYGEAVVRQKLGAIFLHEEDYTPPTRFQ